MAWAILVRAIRIPGRWWQYATDYRMRREVRRWVRYLTSGKRRDRYSRIGWRVVPRVGGGAGYAVVGTIGVASQGSAGAAVTPAWGTGQTRTANNLLICCVSVQGSATLPTTPSGWSIGKQVAGTTCSATIYYKIAAGADAAPTIALITSGVIAAQLCEYSGNATSTPLDQSGSSTGTTSPNTATAAGANVATGELIIMCASDFRSVARASNDTWTSNDGTVNQDGSNNGTSSVDHYSFGSILSATATTAQTSIVTLSITTSITGIANVNASFKLPASTTGWRNAATRFRLLATGWRDAATRFRLLATGWRDAATRFRLLATGWRDAATRFRLLATGWRDAATRFRLVSVGYALIGARGTPVQGAIGAAVTPGWGTGSPRVVGNLLICRVACTGVATLPTTPSGWSLSNNRQGVSCSTAIFYKVAAGGDAAPTVAAITGGVITADLQEWTGNPPTSPWDHGSSTSGITSPRTAACATVDVTPGELVVTAGALLYSVAGSETFTQTYNNGATATEVSNEGASTVDHYVFGDGVTNSNAVATQSAFAYTTTNITGAAFVVETFKVGQLAWRDAPTRFRLLATGYRDAATRFSLVSGATNGWRDVATRFRLVSAATWRDAATRFQLAISGWRDAATRFRIAVAGYRDAATRFRLVTAATWRNANARFRLLVAGWRDAATRFRLVSAATFRDAATRFRLAVAGARDAATRFRLRATAYRDASTRFRLSAIGSRDAATRFRLAVAASRDGSTRFRLVVAGWRDTSARFRLALAGWRNAAIRFRLAISGWRDASTRFWLAVVRDAATRFRLRATGWRDAVTRFNLVTAGVYRDAATRFRLRGITWRDAATRFRLLAIGLRDTATRFSLIGLNWRTTPTRFRLLANGWRNTAIRFRITGGQNARDVKTRFEIALGDITTSTSGLHLGWSTGEVTGGWVVGSAHQGWIPSTPIKEESS